MTIARAGRGPQRRGPRRCPAGHGAAPQATGRRRTIGGVHPIERLRFVARATGVPGDVLAVEATAALMTFAEDPPALVAGCRRVLARQVGCGPLWWACARLLTAQDVRRCAVETIEELEDDSTDVALSLALDHDPDTDPPVVHAAAVGCGSVLAPAGDLAALEAAGPEGPAWVRVGVGVHLSDPMWGALVEHLPPSGAGPRHIVPLDRFTHVAGPVGPLPLVALGEPDCPVAPELFRLAG